MLIGDCVKGAQPPFWLSCCCQKSLALKALAGAAMTVIRDKAIRAGLHGSSPCLEADVVGLTPHMTLRCCGKFGGVTGS